MQHAARAARHTFATGQAVAVCHRNPLPDMAADVDIDRAVERTDAALHAARRVRYDVGFHQYLTAR